MQSKPSVCVGCATGCSIWVDENQGHIWRLRPRENQTVNRWWICDEGRHGFGYVHSPERLNKPLRRTEHGVTAVDWSSALDEIRVRFREADYPAAILSPMLTLEEAELAARWIRSIDPGAMLALGPVPCEGEDQTFGHFTIHAEKCPNRRGVQQVLKKWSGRVVTFHEFMDGLDANRIDAVWIAAGYPHDWLDAPTSARLAAIETVVVHDLFPTPLSDRAAFVLPFAAWAERSGTLVNATGHAQSFTAAIRPLSGVRTVGNVFWSLLGHAGLYRPADVLEGLNTETV